MHAPLASTSIAQSLSTFFEAVGQFFSDLAAVHWPALLLGLLFFGLNLTIRSRAFFNSLRAAYPAVGFQWRRIWGAYFAAVGFNNVVPARGGDVIKLFLTRSSIPGSRYPTVAAAFFVESIFDACVGVLVLIYAFTQGVFPKPPDFSKLSSFDISYLASHFRLTLFLITVLAIAGLVAFAMLSVKARRSGCASVRASRSSATNVATCAKWRRCRSSPGSAGSRPSGSCSMPSGSEVRSNVLLVFAVNQVAGAVPLTPGGAGVQQALLVDVFKGKASTAVVAAYSVGQQIAIAAFTASVGLASIIFIFRFRSFKEVIAAGRASQEAEKEAELEGRDPHEHEDEPFASDEEPPDPEDERAKRRARRARARPAGRPLLKALAGLADQGDRLGKDQRHDGADLLRLGLGVSLDVDPRNCGDRHVDGELDRIVRPGQALVALHLFRELREAPLQLLRITEHIAEAATLHAQIIDCAAHAERRRDPPAGGKRGRAPKPARRSVVRRGFLYLLSAIVISSTLNGAPTVGLFEGLKPALSGIADPPVSPRASEVKFISHHALPLIAGSFLRGDCRGDADGDPAVAARCHRLSPPQHLALARPLVIAGGVSVAVASLAHQIVGAVETHRFAVGNDLSAHAVDQALTKSTPT